MLKMTYRQMTLSLQIKPFPHGAANMGPFYQRGLAFIPAWMNNNMPCKMQDEITYPFPNFNGTAVVDRWTESS